MAKLRLGVIGAGSWTVASHLPAMVEHRGEVDFEIVNWRDPVLLERIRDRFGFARSTTDWHDVIAAAPDLVIVASPVALHHEQTKAALEAGAHVMCEKPFTLDPVQAWDLVDTARRVDRALVIAYGWNYRPMVVRAVELCQQDGGIGVIEQVAIAMSSHTRALLSGTGTYPASRRRRSPSRRRGSTRLSGGGYGQAQVTHALGIALSLAPGLRGRSAFAFMSSPLNAPVELHDAISVRFTNGAVGSIAGGSEHHGPDNDRHKVEVRLHRLGGQLPAQPRSRARLALSGPTDSVMLPVEEGDGIYDCIGPVNALVAFAKGTRGR